MSYVIKTNEYQPVLSHRIFPFLLIFNSVFTVFSTMGVIRGIRWPHITSMVSKLSYKEKKTPLTQYNSRTLIGDKYMESTARNWQKHLNLLFYIDEHD